MHGFFVLHAYNALHSRPLLNLHSVCLRSINAATPYGGYSILVKFVLYLTLKACIANVISFGLLMIYYLNVPDLIIIIFFIGMWQSTDWIINNAKLFSKY